MYRRRTSQAKSRNTFTILSNTFFFSSSDLSISPPWTYMNPAAISRNPVGLRGREVRRLDRLQKLDVEIRAVPRVLDPGVVPGSHCPKTLYLSPKVYTAAWN